MANIGYATLTVIPVMKGIEGDIKGQLGAPLTKAGKQAGQDMGNAIAAGIESAKGKVEAASAKLAKARDKEADAVGKLRTEEAKLTDLRGSGNAKASQLVAAEERVESARRRSSGAVRDADAAVRNHVSAQDELTSAMDRSGESGKRFSLNWGSIGAAALGVAAGIGAAAVGIGAGLLSVASTFDDVSDTIRAGTGATGDVLDSLVQSAKNVGTTVPAEFDKIGPTISQLNQRLGLTGPALEQVASQLLEVGNMTGVEVDINQLSGAMNVFGITGADTAEVLDELWQVSQNTGVGLNELLASAQKGAPALQQFGFGVSESAALVGTLDKAGLDADKSIAGMNKALVNFAKDGKEPQKELYNTVVQIDDFIKSGNEAGALDLSAKLFGTKGAAQFVDAVRAGTFSVDDFVTATGNSHDTILGAAADTHDFAEQWLMLKNQVFVALEPLATKMFGVITQGVTWLKDVGAPAVQQFVQEFTHTEGFQNFVNSLTTQAWPAIQNFAKSALDIGQQILPVLWNVFQTGAKIVGTVARAFADLPGPVKLGVGALVAVRVATALFSAQLATLAGQAAAAGATISATFARIGGAYTTAAAGATRFSAAAGVAAVAGRGMSAAAGGVLSALGGPFTIAIAAATFAVMEMFKANAKVNDSMKVAQQTSEDWAKGNLALHDALLQSGGMVDKSVIDASTSQMDLLRSSSEKMAKDTPGFWAKAALGTRGAIDMMDGDLKENAAQALNLADTYGKAGQKIVDQMDSAGKSSADLAKIITSTDGEFLNFLDSQRKMGSTELVSKLSDQRLQFLLSRDAAIKVTDAMGQIKDKAVGAADGVGALTDAMGKLRGDARTAEDAQKSLTTALDGLKQSLGDGAGAAADAAGKIDLSTTAGVRLDDQMRRVQTAWDEAGAAARTSAADQHLSAQDTERAVADAQAKVRQQFIDTATQSGLTQEQAQNLANVFLAWPPSVSTAINVDTRPGWAEVEKWRGQVEGIPLTVKLYTEMLGAKPGTMPGPISQDQLLNPGGNARGGRISGPGTGTSDSILARLSDGEFVVNAAAARKNMPLLEIINARKYAAGGAVSANDLARFAQGVEGAPYVWGGVHWGDCSGAISALANYATGRDPWGSRFATGSEGSELAARGFKSGLGPAGSLNVGWNNGGPGGGHTSATLPNGVHFEMGGARGDGQYGGQAMGGGDSSHTDFAYLPPEFFKTAAAQIPQGSGGDKTGTGTGTGAGDTSGDAAPQFKTPEEQATQAKEDAFQASLTTMTPEQRANAVMKHDADKKVQDLAKTDQEEWDKANADAQSKWGENWSKAGNAAVMGQFEGTPFANAANKGQTIVNFVQKDLTEAFDKWKRHQSIQASAAASRL